MCWVPSVSGRSVADEGQSRSPVHRPGSGHSQSARRGCVEKVCQVEVLPDGARGDDEERETCGSGVLCRRAGGSAVSENGPFSEAFENHKRRSEKSGEMLLERWQRSQGFAWPTTSGEFLEKVLPWSTDYPEQIVCASSVQVLNVPAQL